MDNRLSQTIRQSESITNEQFKNTQDRFKQQSNDTNMTFCELWVNMVQVFDLVGNLEFSPSEMAEIKKAMALNGGSIEDMAKTAILRQARVTITANEKTNDSKLIEASLMDNNSTVKGLAVMRLKQEYERLIEFNANAEPTERYRITKGLLRDRVGANRKAENEFFAEYKKEIEAHHKKYDIAKLQNKFRTGESLPYSEYKLSKV